MTTLLPADVEEWAAELADNIDQGRYDADLDALAEVLADARSIARVASDLGRMAESRIAQVMAEAGQRSTAAGQWRIDREPRIKTAWDSDALFRQLTARSRVTEDGEPVADGEARRRLIEDLRACLPLTASLAWRVRALQTRGIDPGEYRATETTGWRVAVAHNTDTDTEIEKEEAGT